MRERASELNLNGGGLGDGNCLIRVCVLRWIDRSCESGDMGKGLCSDGRLRIQEGYRGEEQCGRCCYSEWCLPSDGYCEGGFSMWVCGYLGRVG
jgi:hypothetical protein